MKTEPTESLSIKRANIVDKYLPAGDQQRYYQRLEMHEELIDLINSHSPNVEQLEWIEDYGYIKAETPFFKYMVVIIGGKAGLCFDGNDGFLKFKTVYDAKAAAQADFEWRVMACLDIADNSNK